MKLPLKILVYGILVISLVTVVLLIPRKLVIHKIECHSIEKPCSQSLLDVMGKFEGGSYFSAKKGIKDILYKNGNVTEYNISYKLPSTLHVSVLERQPKFIVSKLGTQESVYVDSEGVVLTSGDTNELVKLFISDELPERMEIVNQKMLFSLNLLFDTSQVLQVKEGRIENDSLLIELPGSIRVIFPLEGDSEALIGSLVLIQNELKSVESTKEKELKDGIVSVDLRYKNPVLRKS